MTSRKTFFSLFAIRTVRGTTYVRNFLAYLSSETTEVGETLSALWSITEVLETHIVILSYVIRNHVDIMKYTVFYI